MAVEGVDGRLGLFAAVHLDETETARAVGVAVLDDLRRANGAVGREQVLEIVVVKTVRQVADVQLLGHAGPPSEKSRKTSRTHRGRMPSHETLQVS